MKVLPERAEGFPLIIRHEKTGLQGQDARAFPPLLSVRTRRKNEGVPHRRLEISGHGLDNTEGMAVKEKGSASFALRHGRNIFADKGRKTIREEHIMKTRILSLFLVLLLLGLPALSLGEQAQYMDVGLVVNGETVVSVDEKGGEVLPVVVNGILYVPVYTIPSALGLKYWYDEETNTIHIGEEVERHGLCWVLRETDYEVSKPGADGKETYAYEGVVDGMARFTRSGGYSDSAKWGVCDGTYECQVPAATLYPGDPLALDLKMTIENYSWKGGSKSDINSVHVGTLFVRMNGVSLEDADGNRDLRIGTAAGSPYTDGNAMREGVFGTTVPEGGGEGSKAEIQFQCQSGWIRWTYELVNR